MASGWVKSLQCKSRAFEDVYHPNPKILIPSASCRKSVQSIKDVVDTAKPKSRKPKPKTPLEKHPSSRYPRSTKPEVPFNLNTTGMNRSRSSTSARPTLTPDPFFPSLTELPEGHPSRNVVEIIFHTSWGPKPFAGRIEMIFKVQNGSKTVSRFEEYRETVKARAASATAAAIPTRQGSNWEENARCAVDGNEVMRFHALGPTSGGGPYEAGGACAWSFPGSKGTAICTFSGSGGAHENAGGGRGRKAMLVCRVIAGRVSKRVGFMDSLLDDRVGLDSASGDNGQLLVFDSRAVLPCFLIIYKL
ncbi:hypothetical protein L6164_019600 [Bauhinia variegata]|uniref:Uncharacterized protein n=1 Tax=Bauhinia variegata TaxID=167791 RepID=A0ACB9MSD2_BAUVA|nr:hypothetical protein L6164_019600 [Bauhinia variegata]